jgi:hypothetical protein
LRAQFSAPAIEVIMRTVWKAAEDIGGGIAVVDARDMGATGGGSGWFSVIGVGWVMCFLDQDSKLKQLDFESGLSSYRSNGARVKRVWERLAWRASKPEPTWSR